MKQLAHSDPQIRRQAIRALAESPADTSIAVPVLTRAIGDSDLDVQELAISALGQMGTAAQSSLPALEQALKAPQLSVRLVAALAIQRIAPDDQSYIPVLIDSLRSGHGTVFLEVGKMGADAEWAVPTLIWLLSHREAKIRALAAHTIGQIGVLAGDVESSLRRGLQDHEPTVRRAAQVALEQIRPMQTRTK